jgi:hypothetical protein
MTLPVVSQISTIQGNVFFKKINEDVVAVIFYKKNIIEHNRS